MDRDNQPEMHGSTSASLREVLRLYGEHLPGVGQAAMLATLSAYVAHRLHGPPLWVCLVGAASSGKTETVNSLRGLPQLFPTDNITQAGLLSGSSSSDIDDESTGGLLREMGNSGIIHCSDFTSVLTDHRETQNSVLSAMRNVYDGSFTRRLGTDGGKSFTWEGRAGFIGGATPAIDSLSHLRVALGERFLYHRMTSDLTPEQQARQAVERSAAQDETRDELYSAVHNHLSGITYPTSPMEIPPDILERIALLASHTVIARSAVEYENREITGASPSESTPRLALQLRTHFESLILVGCSKEAAWDVTLKTGLGSIPAIRHQVLESLRLKETGATVTEIVSDWPLSVRRTIQRTLDEVKFLGLAESEEGKGQLGAVWRLSERSVDHAFKIHAPFNLHQENPEPEMEPPPHTVDTDHPAESSETIIPEYVNAYGW